MNCTRSVHRCASLIALSAFLAAAAGLRAQPARITLVPDSIPCVSPGLFERGGELYVAYASRSRSLLTQWRPGSALGPVIDTLTAQPPIVPENDDNDRYYASAWTEPRPAANACVSISRESIQHLHNFSDGGWQPDPVREHLDPHLATPDGWLPLNSDRHSKDLSVAAVNGTEGIVLYEALTGSSWFAKYDASGNLERQWTCTPSSAIYTWVYTGFVTIAQDSVLGTTYNGAEILVPGRTAAPIELPKPPGGYSIIWFQTLTDRSFLRLSKHGAQHRLDLCTVSGTIRASATIDSVTLSAPTIVYNHPDGSFALVYTRPGGLLAWFFNERTLKMAGPYPIASEANPAERPGCIILRDTLYTVWQRYESGPSGGTNVALYGSALPIPPGIVADDATSAPRDGTGRTELAIESVAPNPAHDRADVVVRGTAGMTVPVEICDFLGRVVSRSDISIDSDGRGRHALDFRGMTPGVLLVRAGAATARLLVR